MQTEPRSNEFRLTLLYALAIAVIAAAYRLVPYYFSEPVGRMLWNVAPVGALALFVGSRVRASYAYLIPVLAMVGSDLLLIYPLAQLGHSAFSWGRPVIYASFAVYVLIGRLVGPRVLSPLMIGGAGVAGSMQFFLVSNFLVWLYNPEFPRDFLGLMQCYALGVPFYGNTLGSDLVFSAVFFGLHALLMRGLAPAKVEQPA